MPAEARYCMSCGARSEGRPRTYGARKAVTVLFCDLVESTALGGRLDPESLRSVMARYYSRARTCIEAHGGTLEKFIGDAVMAVFGVPARHEDDALRAARAALDVRDAIAQLAGELEAEIGFGIAIDRKSVV